jgi:signal transduction histidine kinase
MSRASLTSFAAREEIMGTTRWLALTVAFALALGVGRVLAQAQFGSASEAKAMLERAVAELKADEAKALAKFNAGSDGFKDRDLYVFCFDAATGIFSAHPTLMGKDIRSLKDKSGTAFGEQIFTAAKEGAINTVDYMFPRPGGTDPVPKQSFVTRVGKQGCGVGYYKT